MVTGMMPREPRWEYRSGRSAIRQMLAASSSGTTSGGSSRPPSRSARRSRGAHRGVGERGDQRRRRGPGLRTAGTGCRGWRRTRPGRRPAAPPCRGGVTQAMISRVGHGLGRGPGGLVDAVAGLRRRRSARRAGDAAMRGEPGVGQQLGGVGDGGLVQPPGHVVQGVPGAAAARNRAASRSWAAGPQRSRRCSSATVRTKWPASRWASSTVRSPCQQVPPPGLRLVGDPLRVEQPHRPAGVPARSAAVAAHRSDLLEVAIDRRRARTARTGWPARWSCRTGAP